MSFFFWSLLNADDDKMMINDWLLINDRLVINGELENVEI